MTVVQLESADIIKINSADNVLETIDRSGRKRIAQSLITTGADDTVASTFAFVRIPTNAVIIGGILQTDGAFVSAGTATIDLGLFAVDGNILVADEDADVLLDGVDIETGAADFDIYLAASGVASIEDQQKRAFEMLGITDDPQGELEVRATLNTTITTGGVLGLKLEYAID